MAAFGCLSPGLRRSAGPWCRSPVSVTRLLAPSSCTTLHSDALFACEVASPRARSSSRCGFGSSQLPIRRETLLQRRGFASSASGLNGQDPYKVLGVDKNASEAEIKAAYRKQALKWHPDRHPEDKRKTAEEKFNAVASAYETLSNEDKKRAYDAYGAHGPQGFPGGGAHSQASAEEMFRQAFGSADFNSLFRGVLGAQQGPVMLREGMEVQVRNDLRAVLDACRRSRIDSANDNLRQNSLGRRAIVVKVDASDQSVKLEVEGVGKVWFGANAVVPKAQAANESFNGAFGFGFPGGFGSQAMSMHQEKVKLKDGRVVTRITRQVMRPDGTMEAQVFETQ